MLIYPAIDLRGGACVRLHQGRFDQATRYDEDPAVRLAAFAAEGAAWVHIVDLDGAQAGEPRQHELIGTLARGGGVKVQAGGGVRSLDHVRTLLDAGVDRVVVGSVAARAPEQVLGWLGELGPERLTVAMDVRAEAAEPEVAVHGWAKGSGVSLWAALDAYPEGALRHVLVTDVSKDGALAGPNLALMQEIVRRRPDLQLQASGGVRSLEDLADLRAAGAAGAIVGKALYEGLVGLREAIGAG